MAHLSVENVLIFLWHCYVEVFLTFLSLSLALSLSLTPSPSLFLSPSSLYFSDTPEMLLQCNSLFECIQIQGNAAETSFFPGRCDFAMVAGDTGSRVCPFRCAACTEQPSASNHKDLMFKLRGDWPSGLASG